ncbi:hypothetical protein [Kocuria sp. TGY1127_2]|uniref:hypothetical protein n=1 Tax=Kocuria sp. TGY1127_2 TaxID=2711328 RepID=UPI0015B882F4|nr:hypothetical protein [Kocuria sp. TGY1127_2]
MAFKLFRKNSDDDAARRSDDELNDAGRQEETPSSSEVRALPDRPELPKTNGLPEIVTMMESNRVATLQLNQQGNEMTAVMDPSEKPERKTTVDTQSTWFDPVAKLYTAAQASENGPWRRAEIMISSVRNGKRSVEIEYTYPNSDEQVREAYTQTVPTTLSRGGEASSVDAEANQESGRSEGSKVAATGAVAGGAAGAAASNPAKSSDETKPSVEKDRNEALSAVADDAEARKSGDDQASSSSSKPSVLGTPEGSDSGAKSTTSSDSSATVVSGTEKTSAVTDAPRDSKDATKTSSSAQTSSSFSEANAKGSKKQSDSASGVAVGGAALGGAAAGGTAAAVADSGKDSKQGEEKATQQTAPSAKDVDKGADTATTDGQTTAEPVPAVVEDSHWEGEENRPEAGAPSAVAADLPDSVPSTADQTDVAPSYSSSGQSAPQKPSTTQLAPGNLVLTEADVLQRMGEAQKTLFGANGTARDVSTVLIRVRALGSYYDALTHVRRNGFWDQRKTFDLVPEEALHILELKSDSHQEGAGSPIAMMFRFTPGVPPLVSFSYEDEESFVKYKDRLPAQQYIEELRMFPRTGANIPEHMTDALTQWSL